MIRVGAVELGVAEACAAQGIALLGGETADMPGTYYPGAFDLIGFIVGVVERAKLIDGMSIKAGDLLFGLPSNGLHTNGYTLARAALGIGIEGSDPVAARRRLETHNEDLGETLGEALLRPHRCYLNDLKPAMIAEATARAREGAEQFASDSRSRLAGIRRASQGVFEILPRDQAQGIAEGSQVAKVVRVVSTVEYILR